MLEVVAFDRDRLPCAVNGPICSRRIEHGVDQRGYARVTAGSFPRTRLVHSKNDGMESSHAAGGGERTVPSAQSADLVGGDYSEAMLLEKPRLKPVQGIAAGVGAALDVNHHPIGSRRLLHQLPGANRDPPTNEQQKERASAFRATQPYIIELAHQT